jgi:hypothetical protein
MAHTPIPWKATRYSHYGILVTAKKRAIAGMMYRLPEDQANAEFIVRACNAHADLLAALEAAIERCVWQEGNGSDWIDLARAAIARAKEK